MKEVIEFIEKNKIGKHLQNVEMKKHTSYRTGGKASVIPSEEINFYVKH